MRLESILAISFAVLAIISIIINWYISNIIQTDTVIMYIIIIVLITFALAGITIYSIINNQKD